MGYSHYVWRPPELDLERWNEWVGDVRQIVRNLPARVPQTYYPLDGPPVTVQAPLIVSGPIGNVGRPELTDSTVAFNGAGWAEVDGHLQRLSGESFYVDRVFDPSVLDVQLPGDPHESYGPKPDERGWYCEDYKTNHRPYDLAVTASLVRLAHRFPEGVEIGSDGGPEEWQPALDLCGQVFGHAELPFTGHSAQMPAADPDRLNELLAKRAGGLLAPNEVGELCELLDRDLEVDQGHGSVAEPTRRADGPACEP